MTADPDFTPYASPRQLEYLAALEEAGTIIGAARLLNIARSTVQAGLKIVYANAAAHGYSPEHGLNHAIPAPFVARGHSSLDRIGAPAGPLAPGERAQVLQWTKTRLDDAQYQAAIKAGVDAYVGDVVVPLFPAPAMPNRSTDIIPWIEIGDGHLGMLAHEAETGANFDLDIAERELCAAIGLLIDETPACERMVVNDLGDMTHRENRAGETTHSRNKLDCAGTFDQMVETYSRVMRFIVDKALTKAQVVDVLCNKGNHDDTNQVWMAVVLRAAYGHTGRVNVISNQSRFIAYRMGKTLVMSHHSDTCKVDKLVDVMAGDYATDWGETEFRYIDVGHLHHAFSMKEHGGARVEGFNTLAPKDAWAANAGHRGRQSITIIDRSRTYGEVGRRTLPIQRVRDVIAAAHLREGKPAHYQPQALRAFAA
jgi:hypothetical protein